MHIFDKLAEYNKQANRGRLAIEAGKALLRPIGEFLTERAAPVAKALGEAAPKSIREALSPGHYLKHFAPGFYSNVYRNDHTGVLFSPLVASGAISDIAEKSGKNQFGSMKVGSLMMNEKALSNEMLSTYGTETTAKLAFLSFSDDSDFTFKLAKVDMDRAFDWAKANFVKSAHIVKSSGVNIPDNNFTQRDIKFIEKVAEMTGADKDTLKLATGFLKEKFPTLDKNSEVKLATLLIAGGMTKEAVNAANITKPLANIPGGALALMGGLGLAAAAAPAIRKAYIRSSGMPTAYDEIIAADPTLAEYPEQEVRTAINSLYTLSPDLMTDKNTAAHVVRQMVVAPKGGLSVGFLKDLLTTQEMAAPSVIGEPAKMLGSGLGYLGAFMGGAGGV